MAINKIYRIQGLQRLMNFVQDNICNTVDIVSAKPIVDGILLTNQLLTVAVDNPIAHGLGRTPLGWIVVDNPVNSTVWRITMDSLFLTLRASATTTVSLWIF